MSEEPAVRIIKCLKCGSPLGLETDEKDIKIRCLNAGCSLYFHELRVIAIKLDKPPEQKHPPGATKVPQ